MSAKIPMGKPESQRLEFKSAESLRTPSILGRAAVAMLNADGGEIWVGLGEVEGRAAAVESIPDADVAVERLWNHLVDSIEPAPTEDEVAVEVVPVDSQRSLLRIRVEPRDERKPYAHLQKGGRHYVIRAGPRVRAMSREEIFAAARARPEAADDPLAQALSTLAEARKEIQKEGEPRFWIRLQPSRGLDVDVQGPGLERFLRDPAASGNRPSGWTFADPYGSVRLEQNCRILGGAPYSQTRIHRDGWIDYRAPLEWLRHANPGEEEKTIYPLALLERTVSIFRLARAVYQERLFPSGMPDWASRKMRGLAVKRGIWRGNELAFDASVDLALISAQGWRLVPYSPRAMGYIARHEESSLPTKDLVLERPFVFRAPEILQEPDGCAFRLLARVYEAFGYGEEKIPAEFDRRSGRLVLQE